MAEKAVIPISRHRIFKRNYTPSEILGEIKTLIQSGEYKDFMFIANGGNGGRSIRIGSTDRDLRVGDLLFLNELIKEDILDL